MPERFEAGSEQWIGALREVVEQVFADVDLTGVQVGFYEEYLNPPAHLLVDGETTITWRVELSENQVAVGRGRIPDPTFGTEADYEAVLGLAHVLASDPKLPEIVQDLVTKGLFRRIGDRSKLPPHLEAALANVHDRLAERTMEATRGVPRRRPA